MTGEGSDSARDQSVAREEETAPSPSEVSVPDGVDDRRSMASDLLDAAESDPGDVSRDEMAQIVALLSVDDGEARSTAAKALQHLYDRPALFAPYVEALLSAAASYPDDFEGIPAPAVWMGSPHVRATVYATDALARVAQREPSLFVPHVEEMATRLRSDRNVSRYLLFVVGLAEADSPGLVSREWLRDELCDLLDRGRGNGYPSWAADVLGQLGDPEALAAVREAHPGEDADDLAREAFDEAIAALEAAE
ncbi:hypothetical protein [Halobellus sp. EA9]|uniref:hypothetical protein n=1 Tax=Halobellus sp. EA9 TaxID=3421647 RepID=UPI003EB9B3E8